MSQMIVTEVQTTFSPEELQEVSGLPAEIFNEIKDLGALDEFLDHGRYVSRSFVVIRKAARLRRTFDLQSDALALLIHYMAEADALKDKIRHYQLGNINPYLKEELLNLLMFGRSFW